MKHKYNVLSVETCTVNFTNPDKLSDFEVIITPSEFSIVMTTSGSIFTLSR